MHTNTLSTNTNTNSVFCDSLLALFAICLHLPPLLHILKAILRDLKLLLAKACQSMACGSRPSYISTNKSDPFRRGYRSLEKFTGFRWICEGFTVNRRQYSDKKKERSSLRLSFCQSFSNFQSLGLFLPIFLLLLLTLFQVVA